MGGFGGVHEIGRCAGAGEGGGKLAADVPGLADAGDDHPTVGGEDQVDGLDEGIVELVGKRLDRFGLDRQDAAGKVQSTGVRSGNRG